MDESDLFDDRETFKPFQQPDHDDRRPFSSRQEHGQDAIDLEIQEIQGTQEVALEREWITITGGTKTRVCVHYQVHACRRGDSCGFLHEFRELTNCSVAGCRFKKERADQEFCTKHWREKKANYNSSSLYQTFQTSRSYNAVKPPNGLYTNDHSRERDHNHTNSHSRHSSSHVKVYDADKYRGLSRVRDDADALEEIEMKKMFESDNGNGNDNGSKSTGSSSIIRIAPDMKSDFSNPIPTLNSGPSDYVLDSSGSPVHPPVPDSGFDVGGYRPTSPPYPPPDEMSPTSQTISSQFLNTLSQIYPQTQIPTQIHRHTMPPLNLQE